MKPSTPSDERLRAPDQVADVQEPLANADGELPTAAGRREATEQSIGPYRLLQTLGEGGWGVVYLAEQTEPVWRRVALKVIKVGMDTKAVIGRFEAERQALAMMDHPNISKVLDAGETAAGRPYFVMELVRGVRITDYCDQAKASTRERLELFIQVCNAIQHAHQKGIIHRDIKPSNILVTMQDGVPVPKVIDFGIAKSMHGRLTDATVFTAIDQFIGTPAYMSPEQAELSGLDIDTRSDTYSLGVVLYEILTGRPPFDPKTLATAGIDEIRRLIREVEPPPPSSRLRTLTAADIGTVAKHHSVVPAQLSAQLRGDLDWIVMKAIEKQRNRRYETVAALAADVGRHLHDEPVAARPPSAVYRLQKFMVRNKVVAAAVAAVAVVLVAGTVISTWQAVRARQSQDQAEDLLAFMLRDLRAQLDKVGRIDVLEAVAEKALAYFSALNPRDLTTTAQIGWIKAQTLTGEIRLKQGKNEEAMKAFSAAYDRAAALVARHPKDADMLFERGQAEGWIGMLFRKRGAIAKAQEWTTRYRDTGAALVTLEPAKHEWQIERVYGLKNLAALKKDQGDFDGARTEFTTMREVLRTIVAANPNDTQSKFSISDTESWLGTLAERQGDFRAALIHFSAEAQGLQELRAMEPLEMKWQSEKADSLSFQARILGLTGRRVEAQAYLDEARKLIDIVISHDPENRDWARISNSIRLHEANLALAQGNMAEAARLAATARAAFEAFATMKGPKEQYPSGSVAAALRIEAQAWSVLGDARMTDALKRALVLSEDSRRMHPNSEDAISQMAQTLVVAAQIASGSGSGEAVLAYARQTMTLLESRLERTNDWRLLDPAVRALSFLGRREEKVGLQSRLEKMGYVPPVRWPPSAGQRN